MKRDRNIRDIWGQISYGIPYRVFMRFIHKHGFHYAPKKQWQVEISISKLTNKEIRTYPLWCQWCGMRGKVTDMD